MINVGSGLWNAVTNPGKALDGIGNTLVAAVASGTSPISSIRSVNSLALDSKLGTNSNGALKGIQGLVDNLISGNGSERGQAIGELAATYYAGEIAEVVITRTGAAMSALEGGFAAEVPPASGGRLGNATTRAQNSGIAEELQSRGWNITGGGGILPEEYIPPMGGGRSGGSYPDITAIKSGRTLRVNTVDTRVNGTMTTREALNAARIRAQRPNDRLLIVPKSKP